MRSVTIATLIFLAAMHCSTVAHASVRIDRLISDLDHPLWTARRDAAQRIADSKDTSGATIPALIHTLSDVNVEVRRASVQALAAVGAGSELAVSGLPCSSESSGNAWDQTGSRASSPSSRSMDNRSPRSAVGRGRRPPERLDQVPSLRARAASCVRQR